MLRQPFLLLPEEKMRGVGRVDDIDIVDGRLVFLIDALKYTFGARAFHFDVDAWIFRAKRLGYHFCHLDVDGGVPDDFAFLPCGGHHRGRRLLCPQDWHEHEQHDRSAK